MAKDYDDDDDRDKFSERRGGDGRISRRSDGGPIRRRDDDDDYDRDDDDFPRRRFRSDLEPHRGTLILIFGILAFVVCGLFGIPAWVMGSADLKSIADGRMDPAGEGMTKAGYILGIIATALMGVGLVFLILWFGVLVTVAGRR